MEVNVIKMKDYLEKFQSNIKRYEQSIIDMNNLFNGLTASWNDARANVFFDEVNNQKKTFDIQVEQLNQIAKIYSYIINQYSKMGNNIYFDLNQKETIENTLNNYISQLNSIRNLYNNLNLNFNPPEKWSILNDKFSNNKVISGLESIKSNVRLKFANIEQIEKSVASQISKLSIVFLTPIEMAYITNISSDSNQESNLGILDVDDFRNVKDKLYNVKNELEVHSASIVESLNDINSYYLTGNKSKLERLKNNTKKALDKVIENMENCVSILVSTDEGYEDAKDEAIKNFENM